MQDIKWKAKFYLLLALLFIEGGCAHIPQPILPSHIKRIHIPIFKNRTFRYGLEERLTNSVIEAFILDGQLIVAKEEVSDGEIRGEFISYFKEPLSYDDEGYVTEYKLWVKVCLLLYDLHSKEVLWRDKIEEGVIYIPETSSLVGEGMRSETQEEAEKRIIERIASRIVSRTIDGW